jgi:hypothetical protein
LIQETQEIIQLPETDIVSLLMKFKWNLTALIEHWFANKQKLELDLGEEKLGEELVRIPQTDVFLSFLSKIRNNFYDRVSISVTDAAIIICSTKSRLEASRRLFNSWIKLVIRQRNC